MKVTSSIYALAFAAVGMASVDYYANTAPAVPAPQIPPAMPSVVMPVPVTPIPVIADFIYSPVNTTPAPALPTPAYVANPAPAVPPTAAIPANPVAQPDPSAVSSWPAPAPMPAPSPSYRTNNKRELNQSTIDDLVQGTGAITFSANGNSYMLLRLPVDLAKTVSESDAVLRKRANESDLVSDATTKDLDSNAVLYDLLGHVFARVILPVNTKIGISNPEDDGGIGGLLRRDLVDGLLGEVVASVVAPLNVVANINPDEDGNGLVPNLLGRVSATIQASPTITAHIFDPDSYDGAGLLRRDLVDGLLGEVVASVVAPVNIVANINPDEDGNGLVPNLLGRVSATIQASPTITAHIFDPDNYDDAELARRDLVDGLLGEVVASVVAPLNVVANINPDEDGNGLVPNLLGR
ncbi:hypothetical protein LPJ53_006278, partial [Coemansia erecta]